MNSQYIIQYSIFLSMFVLTALVIIYALYDCLYGKMVDRNTDDLIKKQLDEIYFEPNNSFKDISELSDNEMEYIINVPHNYMDHVLLSDEIKAVLARPGHKLEQTRFEEIINNHKGAK